MSTIFDIRKRRAKPFVVALVAGALWLVYGAVSAFANAGNPTSTSATWQYVSGASGPIIVTVSGNWSWSGTDDDGDGSQSCLSGGGPGPGGPGGPGAPGGAGGTLSQTNVDGHYAVGIAVAWGDSSTPNTLSVAGTTLKLGSGMDYLNAAFCAGTTKSSPYPSGSYSASHQYSSLAAFLADTSNGQVCVNAYDVHQNNANEENPIQNKDNTLSNKEFDPSDDCSTARLDQPADDAEPARDS